VFNIKHNWRLIEAKGLSVGSNRYREIILQNEQVGFIIGSEEIHKGPLMKAVFYRTEDGGNNWERNELGEGAILDIDIVGNEMVMLRGY